MPHPPFQGLRQSWYVCMSPVFALCRYRPAAATHNLVIRRYVRFIRTAVVAVALLGAAVQRREVLLLLNQGWGGVDWWMGERVDELAGIILPCII